MNSRQSKCYKCLTALLGFCLSLALQTQAQPRPGGGGMGGGGFGGIPGGGTSRSSTSTGGSTARTYPNNTSIGDAYFSIDPESRRIVYITDEATARYISQVLTNLDRPKPQVLIKVVFVEVALNDASDIGIEGGWGKQINNDPTAAAAVQGFGMSGLSSIVGSNANKFNQPISSFTPSGPVTQPGAGLFTLVNPNYVVTLRAIAQAGKAKILSRPSILARNNQPATITVGQQVPLITGTRYDNYGNAINTITYTDVGVILKVTPFITADGLVQMIVSPSISSIDQSQTVQIQANLNAPVINIRSADTVAVTGDGQTVIIGGLIGSVKTKIDTKIPVLGDIPLLGNLFKRQQSSDTKSELIIFLTPHIVQTPTELAALSVSERAKSGATQGLTERELSQFLDALPANYSGSKPAPKPGQ